MVTRQEQINTNSPVVPYAIFGDPLKFCKKFAQINFSNMTIFRVLFCHILLLGIVLSSPVDNKPKEQISNLEITTHTPLKVNAVKSINKEQTQSLNNAQTEKSATKKRDVPEILTDRNEYIDDDLYEGRGTDDYDVNQALRAYIDNTKNDNSIFGSGKHKVNDYRYYDEEARRKRTPNYDEIFNRADTYREPRIHLTPEDFMILAAYRQQYQSPNNPYGQLFELNNGIDVPDSEVEGDEIYDRPENFFDRYYDQRYRNWANLPTSNKFILNRQRRSYMGYPKLRVPVYKRSVL